MPDVLATLVSGFALHLQLQHLSRLGELCLLTVFLRQLHACKCPTGNCASCAGLLDRIKSFASKRKMEDGTLGPVITWTTDKMLGHVDKLTQIPGGCCSALRNVLPALLQPIDEPPGRH